MIDATALLLITLREHPSEAEHWLWWWRSIGGGERQDGGSYLAAELSRLHPELVDESRTTRPETVLLRGAR